MKKDQYCILKIFDCLSLWVLYPYMHKRYNYLECHNNWNTFIRYQNAKVRKLKHVLVMYICINLLRVILKLILVKGQQQNMCYLYIIRNIFLKKTIFLCFLHILLHITKHYLENEFIAGSRNIKSFG